MNRRAIIMAIFIGVVLFTGLGFKVTPVLARGGGNLHQEIHWMVYGYDRVWYHNRAYVSPSKELSPKQVVKQIGQRKKLIPTGEKVIGLPVYDTQHSLAFQKQINVVPALLILKKHNGDFIVYSLSGGP